MRHSSNPLSEGDDPQQNSAENEALTQPSMLVQLSWADVQQAVLRGTIEPMQASKLWASWTAPGSTTRLVPQGTALAFAGPKFNFTNTLYYFGGMLAIGAMTLFMTLGWEMFGPWGVLALALGYMAGAVLLANKLLEGKLPTPAGIFATLAVCLVPLSVWALQQGLGLWPTGGSGSYRDYHRLIDWRWLTLELATLTAAVVMLKLYRLPFMVMPVAVTLWYLSMDVAHMLMAKDGFDWQFTRDVSLVFGLFTCALAVWTDLRSRRALHAEDRQDFAQWLYLFGALMFWCGLSLRESQSEMSKLMYALLNVGLVFVGAAIGRRVFTVLGALGVAAYLGYLAYRVFADSLLFPFVLSLMGLAVVALGIWWQRHESELNVRLSAFLPAALKPLAGD